MSIHCRLGLDAGFDEVEEKRMGVENRRGVFRMELGADEPRVVGQFNHFDKVACGVGADTLHAVAFEVGKIMVVEFVSVAMTLLDVGLSVDGTSLAVLS